MCVCVCGVLCKTFCPSASLKEWQSKMAELLKKQREKGGVINPAREDNVIDELWTWVRACKFNVVCTRLYMYTNCKWVAMRLVALTLNCSIIIEPKEDNNKG